MKNRREIDERNLLEGYMIEKEAIGDEPWKWESDYEVLPSDTNKLMRLVRIIGKEQFSSIELTEKIGLRHREVLFKSFYLTPAIESGLVRMLYPDTPSHPHQKYLLTAKGLKCYEELSR